MDLASVIVFGLASSLVGLLSAGLTFYALKPRLEEAVYGEIESFLADIPRLIEEKPEIMENLAKSILPHLLKALPTEGEGKEAYIRLPILGRVPASLVMPLVQQFIGGSVKKAQTDLLSTVMPQIGG